MISYAQNFEDVLLMRALKHIEGGTYVDVGAQDPVQNSVSLAFYERGWRGIHVEPSPVAAAALRKARPDELTIEAAISTTPGQMSLTEFSGTGLTTGVVEIARKHKEANWTANMLVAKTVTLAEVLQRLDGRDIHWLKIDVEGMEGDVLKSWGESWIRPWIVVIESTIPMSSEESYSGWEPELLERGYTFAYFDGLNRYYIHEAHRELTVSFGSSPNYFDDFSITEDSPFAKHLNEKYQAEAKSLEEALKTAEETNKKYQTEANSLQKSLKTAEEKNEQYQAEAKSLEEALKTAEEKRTELAEEKLRLQIDCAALDYHIARVNSSTVWRLTAPIRAFTGPYSDPRDWRRALWERFLFRPSGRPLKPIRRALFHTNGKPRGVFRNWILRDDGTPRRAFQIWMGSDAYRNLPRAHLTRGSPQGMLVDSSGKGKKGRRRVAIVAPISPVGSIGGAERFYRGLVRAMQDLAFDADLITVPFDESTFETIQAGYAAFEAMNLDEYDFVISTKAPSYCIQHRNHVLYLVHTIRVFYDMFDVTFPDADESRIKQQAWIHARDTEAISRIERRYAIGDEVAQRLYTYNGLKAKVLHPGLDIAAPTPSPVGDYLFLPGRLHRWKRVDLAIQAVRRSALPIKLRISGTGEEEAALRKLAGDDPRIVFEGYVDDKRLASLYSGALGVVFCPINEDYGYVTVEAFAHGKPVITCTDSGEPLQFVTNGVTGFVTNPDPDSIRVAIERLWSDREAAQRMGTEAAVVVRTITWDRVARELARRPGALAPRLLGDASRGRLRVAVLDMQPITPPIGGGRLRLLGLYHDLGDDFETRYVGAYDWRGELYRRKQITPSLEEIVLPLSAAHYAAAEEARTKASGKVVIDMLFSTQAHLSPDYIDEMNAAVAWADIVVFSHPWAAPLVSDDALDGKLVVYDSQNVEIDLRAHLLDPNDGFQASVIEEVERAERLVGSRANLIITCSPEDADRFTEHYGFPLSSIEVVPNGVFMGDFSTPDATGKAAARRRVGLGDQTVAVFFIGSDYAPNVKAASEIVWRIAPACPDVTFLIAGGVCTSLPHQLPKNVRALGQVSDKELRDWLTGCDIALNPMLSGSGTNIKMFEYAAASLPIVTTPIGARGIVQTSSHGITVCDIDGMPAAINSLARDVAHRSAAGAMNRQLVEGRFSWERLSRELGRLLAMELLKVRGRKNEEWMIANKVKIAHFTTVGQRCGIGEYTRHLVDAMDDLGYHSIIFTCDMPGSAPDLSGIEDRSIVAWFNDNVRYRDSALHDDIDTLVAESGADYAIIQHHPGFLPPDELRRLAVAFQTHGARVAVVMHSYLHEQAGLIAELTAMDVPVFSHKKRDVIEAEAHGVNLLHLPLAIPKRAGTQRRIAPRDAASPTIVSNGFLREHKGIVRLVEAFALVREEIPKARLRLLCSLYPSADSEKAKQDVEQAISRLDLEFSVEFDTGYHEKDDLLNALADADIAAFPYSASAEGGSAAVADAIAVGLPVVVSPSAIFDDIRHVALTCPTDARALADALLDTLTSQEKYLRLARRSWAYAERNSWRGVIDTLAGLLAVRVIPKAERDGSL